MQKEVDRLEGTYSNFCPQSILTRTEICFITSSLFQIRKKKKLIGTAVLLKSFLVFSFSINNLLDFFIIFNFCWEISPICLPSNSNSKVYLWNFKQQKKSLKFVVIFLGLLWFFHFLWERETESIFTSKKLLRILFLKIKCQNHRNFKFSINPNFNLIFFLFFLWFVVYDFVFCVANLYGCSYLNEIFFNKNQTICCTNALKTKCFRKKWKQLYMIFRTCNLQCKTESLIYSQLNQKKEELKKMKY